MNNIILNSLRENVRNKVLYIISIIAVVLFTVILTGRGLKINGENVNSYESLIPVAVQLVNFMGCFIAVFISMNSIPKEYERKTTHLILIRGIKKQQLNLAITFSNIITSALGVIILSLSLFLLALFFHDLNDFIKIAGAVLIIILNTTIVSSIVSVFSLYLPSVLTGFLGITVYIFGVFHNQLELLAHLTHGAAKLLCQAGTLLIPDLYGISNISGKIITGDNMTPSPILFGILYCYIILALMLIPYRKEA